MIKQLCILTLILTTQSYQLCAADKDKDLKKEVERSQEDQTRYNRIVYLMRMSDVGHQGTNTRSLDEGLELYFYSIEHSSLYDQAKASIKK